jgi:Tol biopolymer transport system component
MTPSPAAGAATLPDATQAEVLIELERILADPLFQTSNQLAAFLRFVVENTLAGKSEQLKEYVIGVEVLKRGPAYNPREDPAVRIVAGRLRSKLAEYYQGSGQSDQVHIELPRGGYVPAFECRRNGTTTADVAPQEAKRSGGRRTLLTTISLLCFVLAAGVVTWFAGLRTAPRQTLTPAPLTSYPGQEMQPSFSPEGNHVAFSWNGEKQDNFDIYIKQIGSDKPIRLTTDPARDFSPAWSPDGRTIAFGRLLNLKSSGIFLIPALGGPERKLTESTAPAGFRPRPFLAWSPDGKWLAFSDVDIETDGHIAPTGSIPVSLFLISVETGEKRRLTSRPTDSVGDAGPAFAPDGHALAFVRTQTLAIANLYLLPLSRNLVPKGEPHRVTSGSVFTSSPSWSPDGKDIIYASGRWDRLQLWRVAEAGTSPPQRLEFLADRAADPTVSRHGQVAYSQKSTDINIWRTELPESGREGSPPTRFIASTQIDGNPQYSPDGKRIVFPTDRSGSREIWICNEDGSNTTQLTSMGAPISGSPRWSPDGTRIVFDSNVEGQFELYVVSASGGPVKRMTNSPADEAYGRWSLDGRWIYFMSSRTGQRQIWKMPSNGGEAVQVTKNGGVVPFPSPDDTFLYYSERAGEGERNGMGGLRRLQLANGHDEQILPSVTFLNVEVTRDGIYFVPRADSEGHHSVFFFNFRTGKISPIVRLSGRVSEGLAVSRDGRSLLFTQIDEQRSDLMLVEGFR